MNYNVSFVLYDCIILLCRVFGSETCDDGCHPFKHHESVIFIPCDQAHTCLNNYLSFEPQYVCVAELAKRVVSLSVKV